VAAVVLAAVAVGGALHFARSAQPAGAAGVGGSGVGGPVSGPPASSYVAAGLVPPYYVAITANGNPDVVPSYAVVRATATGATLGTIMPSLPGGTIRAMTAAADDRTFVLDEEKWGQQSRSFDPAIQLRSFYLVRLDSSGKPGTPSKLPIMGVKILTGMALSPDGTRLAVAIRQLTSSVTAYLAEMQIYQLATGEVRTWSRNGGFIGSSSTGDQGSLSWTADGRLLAFSWGSAPYSGPANGTWLLNTTLGGSNLIGNSHQVVSFYKADKAPSPTSGPSPSPSALAPFSSFTCQSIPIVTPDGSTVICEVSQELTEPTPSSSRQTVETACYEYSTATGKIVHILGHWTIKNASTGFMPDVLWSSSSGAVIIGTIPGTGSTRVGIISGNHFTLLAAIPIPANSLPIFAAAW
jgi:hypothetical protein